MRAGRPRRAIYHPPLACPDVDAGAAPGCRTARFDAEPSAQLGLAPGPYLVGVLSDSIGLKSALTIVPVAGLFASACFRLAAGSCERDVAAKAARLDR